MIEDGSPGEALKTLRHLEDELQAELPAPKVWKCPEPACPYQSTEPGAWERHYHRLAPVPTSREEHEAILALFRETSEKLGRIAA